MASSEIEHGNILEYQYNSKKVERILSLILLALFFISLDKSIFSLYTILFYAIIFVCLLYYFIWFRKKPAYVTIKGDSTIISRGFFLQPEEIKNDAVKKVNITDKKVVVLFLKNGVEDKVSIFNILLDAKDKDAVINHLKGLAM